MTLDRAALQPVPFLAGRRAAEMAGAVRADSRVFLSAQSALQSDGSVKGLGDPAAQADAALDRIEAALSAVGGSLRDVTKLVTCIVDRGHREAVYGAIARRLKGVHFVSTGLIVAGLPRPELMVQIDADAVLAGDAPLPRIRPYTFDSWHGQGFAWQGAMVVVSDGELFIRGQTGDSLDHKDVVGLGRTPEDAARQADRALANLRTLLEEAGASLEDVCKITVFISDRAYRPAVYPIIGKHFRGVHPVSTGIITTGFARPEILFEIDVQAAPKQSGRPHERLRTYHSSVARYGFQTQALDCDFSMAVRAGRRIFLRGQTGVGLDEAMHGAGDAAAQAVQAMTNVTELLADAGARLSDVAKATVYVTDRAFLEEACEVVLRRLEHEPPAFSAFVVKGLASPELLMEVDVTAMPPERSG